MRWTVGALTGAVVLVLAAGCGTASDGPGTTQPGIGGQPGATAQTSPPKNVNVAAALKIANDEFGLLTKGDWAGAWRLWTDTAKKEVSKDVFVKANTSCPAALRRQYQLQEVKPMNDQLIELTYRRGETVQHGALRNAKSGWQFEPGAELLAEYASGASAVIDKRKATAQC